MKKFLICLGLFLALVIAGLTSYVLASPDCNIFNRAGCCSHHGGVCGCMGNRAKCCDGTLSPSCGCY
jgi:hypothetical protein